MFFFWLCFVEIDRYREAKECFFKPLFYRAMSAAVKGRHKGQREEQTPKRPPSTSCPSPLRPVPPHQKNSLARGATSILTTTVGYFWPFFFLASCFW